MENLEAPAFQVSGVKLTLVPRVSSGKARKIRVYGGFMGGSYAFL